MDGVKVGFAGVAVEGEGVIGVVKVEVGRLFEGFFSTFGFGVFWLFEGVGIGATGFVFFSIFGAVGEIDDAEAELAEVEAVVVGKMREGVSFFIGFSTGTVGFAEDSGASSAVLAFFSGGVLFVGDS